jgi:chromosome segregation ATPase
VSQNLFLYAALAVTGGLAIYGVSSAASLRAELDELKSRPAAVLSEELPAATPIEPLGIGSLEERVAALEAAARRQESTIAALQLRALSLANNAGLPVDSSGALSGAAAESVLSLIEQDQQKKRQERSEARFKEISDRVTTHREAFAATHNLNSSQKEQLSSLEENLKAQAKEIANDITSGAISWRDARPNIQEIATDAFSQLDGILGKELAATYLNELEEDLPMLRRIREPNDRPNRP